MDTRTELPAIRKRRYDLVIRRQHVKLPAVEALLDGLNRAALRRKLEILAGYDTSRTGEVGSAGVKPYVKIQVQYYLGVSLRGWTHP